MYSLSELSAYNELCEKTKQTAAKEARFLLAYLNTFPAVLLFLKMRCLNKGYC